MRKGECIQILRYAQDDTAIGKSCDGTPLFDVFSKHPIVDGFFEEMYRFQCFQFSVVKHMA